MNRKLLMMAAMGLAALLFIAGAMAQDNAKNRPRVMVNGKEDAGLSSRAQTRGDKVMVPDQPFFHAVGSEVTQQRGWVPPGSQQPDRDRASQWNVTQRNGRELRYRSGDRLYYYGGAPHYWSVAPYESGGSLYLSIGDLALTLGGGYNYDPGYNSGQITLCEGGYCPAPGQVRLTYPYPDSYPGYNSSGQIVVQGYASPSALVRVQVYQQMPFPFRNRDVYTHTMPANRNGLFSVPVYVHEHGEYRVNVDLLDDYGNRLTRQTSTFYVR